MFPVADGRLSPGNGHVSGMVHELGTLLVVDGGQVPDIPSNVTLVDDDNDFIPGNGHVSGMVHELGPLLDIGCGQVPDIPGVALDVLDILDDDGDPFSNVFSFLNFSSFLILT